MRRGGVDGEGRRWRELDELMDGRGGDEVVEAVAVPDALGIGPTDARQVAGTWFPHVWLLSSDAVTRFRPVGAQ